MKNSCQLDTQPDRYQGLYRLQLFIAGFQVYWPAFRRLKSAQGATNCSLFVLASSQLTLRATTARSGRSHPVERESGSGAARCGADKGRLATGGGWWMADGGWRMADGGAHNGDRALDRRPARASTRALANEPQRAEVTRGQPRAVNKCGDAPSGKSRGRGRRQTGPRSCSWPKKRRINLVMRAGHAMVARRHEQ